MSPIWNQKHDFRWKLHDTKFNYNVTLHYNHFEIAEFSQYQFFVFKTEMVQFRTEMMWFRTWMIRFWTDVI